LKIITPSYILTPNELKTGLSIAFETEIVSIDTKANLLVKYPDAELIETKEHSLLMPGLINAHVHLEFSGNTTELTYGDFLPWLHSVIENREDLVNNCGVACMNRATDLMLHSGITAYGAISSHGMDLEAAIMSPQKVVFFNELIGSQATMADALFTDFLARLNASKSVKRRGFASGVAIHSPYSVHPILVKKALEIVKNESLALSAHFMESKSEREWLDSSEGPFREFFENFLKQSHAVCDASEFLSYFDDVSTLMTHVVHASECEIQELATHQHTVVHCPISNRLLGGGAINLDDLEQHNINWLTATDGLSSNYTLNLFEEMKAALFMHSDTPLLPLANRLLESVTTKAATALNLNCGAIEVGKDADMLLLQLDSEPNEQLKLHLILHQYPITSVFIDGQKVL
jgi:cytosine/adenosine deaminase-related metal-dependent hydrolase